MNAAPSAVSYASVAKRPPAASPTEQAPAARTEMVTLGGSAKRTAAVPAARMPQPAMRLGTGPGAPRIRAPRRAPAALKAKAAAGPSVGAPPRAGLPLSVASGAPAAPRNVATAACQDPSSLGSPPVGGPWLQRPSYTPAVSSCSVPSIFASGTDSSFAMVSGAASSAVELDSAASWSVVGDRDGQGDEAHAASDERGPREFSARSRLPADRLLGDPVDAFNVGELERRLVALNQQHTLGGEVCNELFTRMALAPASSHVKLAMQSVERHLRETDTAELLPALAGQFLQFNDPRAAASLHDMLRRARGQMRADITLADVAAYLLLARSGCDNRWSRKDLALLRARCDALESLWRTQTQGMWTLDVPA